MIDQIELKMKHYVDKVDRGLARELELYSGSRFHDPLVYATEGGKRIRPIILMMSAEALGYTDDHLLDAAVAFELLHTESMIHEALRLYTENAASNGFDEGTWERYARDSSPDLTILDSDIRNIHPAMLRKVGVAATVMNGRVAYSYESVP